MLVGIGVCCLIAFALMLERDETRGFISGGVDAADNCVDNWRIGGLGGGDDSGDTVESTDLELIRFLGVSLNGTFVGGGDCCITLVAL